MEYKTISMRYRLSSRDAYYGGGLVDAPRMMQMMGDCASRLLAREFGNAGRCVEIEKSRVYVPCFAGDYLEYLARILKVEGKRVTVETRSFKEVAVPENPPFESSVDILEDPELTMAMIMVYELN